MHDTWYDEAFDPDGRPRPPYASLRARLGWDPLSPAPAVVDRLGSRPLDDDTRILPVPLVLDEIEYRTVVQAGAAQRARALQQLFADLVLGSQRILTAGTGLDRDVLDDVLAADGTSLDRLRGLWQGRHRGEVRFVHGPDLIRDHAGRWTVLEDNVGCVGGSADSFVVADRYRTAAGWAGHSGHRSAPDLDVAVRRWLRRLGRSPAEAPAVLGGETDDDLRAVLIRENRRRHAILDVVGVPVLNRRLVGRTVDRAPPALVNFDVDAALTDLFHNGRTAMFNAPGTGVLGSKALLPFLDDVIRYFTGADPILATPPTRLLHDGTLPADPDDWVVKTSAGCQGTEVFVLGWQPRPRLPLIEKRLRTGWRPAGAVAQRYVEPSRLTPAGPRHWLGYRVEIRPVTYVLDWQETYVGEQPLGKAVSTHDSRRLNNISQGACYLPVIREFCDHRKD